MPNGYGLNELSNARGGICGGYEKGTKDVGMEREDVGALIGTACADLREIEHALKQTMGGTLGEVEKKIT